MERRYCDIKPYLPYVDCMPDARGGFADRGEGLCAGGRDSGETIC